MAPTPPLLQALNDMHVLLEGTLLKPNMVLNGGWLLASQF